MPAAAYAKVPEPPSRLAETEPFEVLLPKLAYVEAVRDLANSETWIGKAVPMSLCVGPAIKWAQLNTLLLWACTLGNCFLTYCMTECTHDAVRTSKSSVMWVLLGSLQAIIFLVCTCLEFICLRFTTVPFVQIAGQFKVLGLKVSFWVWLAVAFLQSTLMKADMITDGKFVAILLRQEECPGQQINYLWKAVTAHSVMPGLASVKLSHLALIVFLLTLGQCIWPAVQSTPKCGEPNVDYCIAAALPDSSSERQKFDFTNLLGQNVKLGDAMMMLGEAASMASLQLQSPTYPFAKARLEPRKAVSLAGATMSRGVVSIGLVAVLENSVQIHFQVFIFAVHRLLSKTCNTLAVTSLVLSMLMLVVKFKQAYTLLSFSHQVLSGAGDEATHSRHFRDLLRYTRILKMMVLALLFSIAHGVAQFVGAFVCKDSLWNMLGCVDLEALGKV